MTDAVISVVKCLDTLIDDRQHSRDVDHLPTQCHPQAKKWRTRLITRIRKHRHKVEPATQRRIQQGKRPVRCVHRADDVKVGWHRERFARIRQRDRDGIFRTLALACSINVISSPKILLMLPRLISSMTMAKRWSGARRALQQRSLNAPGGHNERAQTAYRGNEGCSARAHNEAKGSVWAVVPYFLCCEHDWGHHGDVHREGRIPARACQDRRLDLLGRATILDRRSFEQRRMTWKFWS